MPKRTIKQYVILDFSLVAILCVLGYWDWHAGWRLITIPVWIAALANLYMAFRWYQFKNNWNLPWNYRVGEKS